MNTLRVLPLGSSDVDEAALLLPGIAAPGRRVVTPVYAYLLEVPGGAVLVDTGMSPVHIEEPGAGFEPGLAPPLPPPVTDARRPDHRPPRARPPPAGLPRPSQP